MRQWRVGTFTMGIILIVLGIILMFAQFKNISMLQTIFTWWPLSLIFLGIEVLAYINFSKNGQNRVIYDGFSIFLILIILIITIGAYTGKTVLDSIPHNSNVQFIISFK